MINPLALPAYPPETTQVSLGRVSQTLLEEWASRQWATQTTDMLTVGLPDQAYSAESFYRILIILAVAVVVAMLVAAVTEE